MARKSKGTLNMGEFFPPVEPVEDVAAPQAGAISDEALAELLAASQVIGSTAVNRQIGRLRMVHTGQAGVYVFIADASQSVKTVGGEADGRQTYVPGGRSIGGFKAADGTPVKLDFLMQETSRHLRQRTGETSARGKRSAS